MFNPRLAIVYKSINEACPAHAQKGGLVDNLSKGSWVTSSTKPPMVNTYSENDMFQAIPGVNIQPPW